MGIARNWAKIISCKNVMKCEGRKYGARARKPFRLPLTIKKLPARLFQVICDVSMGMGLHV